MSLKVERKLSSFQGPTLPTAQPTPVPSPRLASKVHLVEKKNTTMQHFWRPRRVAEVVAIVEEAVPCVALEVAVV